MAPLGILRAKADPIVYPNSGHAFVAQDRILDRRATAHDGFSIHALPI
jgi:hypothetical protein